MQADPARLERRTFVDTRRCCSVEFAVAPGVKLTVPAWFVRHPHDGSFDLVEAPPAGLATCPPKELLTP